MEASTVGLTDHRAMGEECSKRVARRIQGREIRTRECSRKEEQHMQRFSD